VTGTRERRRTWSVVIKKSLQSAFSRLGHSWKGEPVTVSLYPCSMCGKRTLEKLSSATWAWWRVDNVRVAYRQRLCVSCVVQHVAPLEINTREAALICPLCGTSSVDDMDPVYLTVYVPGTGKVRLELPLDGACAV
jgi:predicted RNA-binding Zn-ribbon protein involved in translation (DUF1610 family)